MKIERLEYWDKSINWGFPPITFHKFNLLVGVSGVGKTKIIESIYNLRKIALGESLKGIKWDVTFARDDGTKYCWQGEFETERHQSIELQEEDDGYNIIHEVLEINGQVIVERNQDEIRFKGNITPKLSPYQSLVDIFRNEKEIAAIQQEWQKIILSDTKKQKLWRGGGIIDTLKSLIDTLGLKFYISFMTNLNLFPNHPNHVVTERIRQSNSSMLGKLAFLSNHPEEFKVIKQWFSNIFVQVEDIKIELPDVYIKEKGVEAWIPYKNLSSGMRKTLNFICELYLSPPGSVMIIDEFENSLGVNCIDIIAEDFLGEERDFQFIITSHHLYIINNIPQAYWKIVTRKGGVVTVKDAQDLDLGKSKHKAFMQLINNQDFKEGIIVE